jgi:hypothetical protein
MALIVDQPEDLPVSSDALASTNPLDSQPIQGALIEAAMVQFSGNSGDLLDNPPDLDHERVYIVKATCIEVKNKRRDDGEVRTTTVMKIESCYERGRVPIVDEAQPSLYSVPAEDAEGGDGDE